MGSSYWSDRDVTWTVHILHKHSHMYYGKENIFSHSAELQVNLLHAFCLGYLLSSHAKYAIDSNALYV